MNTVTIDISALLTQILVISSLMAAVIGISLGVAQYRYSKTRDWRAEFRAMQLENLRWHRKSNEDMKQFFKGMGVRVEQIFERVDKPPYGDEEDYSAL